MKDLNMYLTNLAKPLLLVAFAFVITMVLQGWVGRHTIYEDSLNELRLEFHNAILEDKLPEWYPAWATPGSNATTARVFVVFLADLIHQITGLDLNRIYWLIDSTCLFAIIIALLTYLKKWFDNLYCTIGVLYFCSILPLTYFLYDFHPWDRLSLLVWIFLLYLIREEKIVAFVGVLAISITIKADTVLLPGLYFLYRISREHWQKTSVTTLFMFTVSFGVYFLLLYMRPGGTDSGIYEQVLIQVKRNFGDMLGYHLKYPPFLGLSIPVLLAFLGLRSKEKDRFALACTIFAFALVVPSFLFARFVEFRLLMPVLVLMLPSSLLGLKLILQPKTKILEPHLPEISKSSLGNYSDRLLHRSREP